MNLNRRVGDMNYDILLADINPPAEVASGTLRKLAAKAGYKRGTILAKSSDDGKLVILGSTAGSEETLTADCILCDDIEVGTEADAVAAVYVSGNFNTIGVIVKDGYTITEADKDKLRERGIMFSHVENKEEE